MSLEELFRRPEKLTEQPQVNSPVLVVPQTTRVRKTTGQYPTLRAALVEAIIKTETGRNCSKIEGALRADDLAEATELALLTYCQATFDRKLDQLRDELRTSEPNLGPSRRRSPPMRQMILALVLSSILIPVAAHQQGLAFPQNVPWSELKDYCHVAVTRASTFYERANEWLRVELR